MTDESPSPAAETDFPNGFFEPSTARNNGNQDLTNFQLSDSLINSAQIRCSPVAIGGTLTVATGLTTCTGVYAVTQADINRGLTLTNTAIAQTTQAGISRTAPAEDPGEHKTEYLTARL